MSRTWADEGWRLVLGIIVALFAGLITGYGLIFLVGFLCIYAVWMIYRFTELEDWLRDGGSKKQAPDTIGIASEIMQLIYRDKRYSEKQRERLRTSLSRFNDMAAELPDATVVLNQLQQIIWSNVAASTLLGISRSKDGGQRIDNLIRNPAFHRFLHDTDTSNELEINSPTNPQKMIALRIVQSSGSSILTARDITQRVLVREMRKAFVADVSHELRTPLTVIQGYMELLNDDPSISEEVQAALKNVTDQSARMSNIVDDLLTLSRLESSNLDPSEGEEINLSTLVSSVLNEINHAQPKGYLLHTDIDDSIALFGKQNELYSACQNLVQNALKYTPPGTAISVKWQPNNDGAALTVADTGPGISSLHLPRLSERFYRVDKGRSRESGGTGLGLAIVKYIAQRHGGQLNIRSQLGTGSEFELFFPAERLIKKIPTKNSLTGR